MWIPNRVFELFQVNTDALATLKDALLTTQVELAAAKTELITTKANFAWLTGRCNTLEYENRVLMEKAYNIKVPAPQFVTSPRPDPMAIQDFSFDDVGDTVGKRLGFDMHDVKN